ncbi:thiolase-like protein [Rhodocollybia butyracea]|uniref:Thiolase-like protein n=1 Tax=Rhodocollybia butyracea TaxID=206335 RepID=A0A9P5U347_9AGAR|nr:thiolase-like protein [Rhodocollybia butyracea]
MASFSGKIAIIGMACRLPGGTHSPDEFWSLLLSEKCTMEDIPSSRFNIEDYWSENPGDSNKMPARKGHFLRDGMLFDEAFFNISPREATNTDPQHRVLLETVVDAMDDAGYKASSNGGEHGWDKSKIGVFIGSAGDSYQNNLTSQPIDAFFSTGTIRGFSGGRISHHFGWQGPSIVYDTACSSSLVAVHAACQSLLLNECNAAVASAVNMCTSPEMYIALSKGFFISNTEGCRTFDETADGYCRGEGVGVVVLKRFEDALRDKDKIDAVIVASGVNQSGLSESLTTPHPAIQADLFVENCKRANISPLSVCAVEAHGTGTQAGDFAEMEAIKMAYCDGREYLPETKLFVASVKPNVGHSESAAGLTSLIKAVLMTKHRKVSPHIGIITRRNPRLGNLEQAGIVIPTTPQELRPINGEGHIFIAVHSFGAPGGNASVIIQDAPMPSYHLDQFTSDPRTHHVIVLSAKPHTPLSTVGKQLLEHLNNTEAMSLSSLSYTTTARREDYSSRIALSVSSIDDLKDQLQACFTHETNSSSTTMPRVGFLIGGNGSQFQGMGKLLYETSPIFRKQIAACSTVAQELGVHGLLDLIMGDINPVLENPASELLGAVGIVSVGYALGKMWIDWGVRPQLLLGHSLGEYVGLALAGCISIADAMRLVITKIEAVHASSHYPNGGMLAVGLSPHDAKEIISLSGCRELEIACINGTSQTVISGTRLELLKLQSFIQSMPHLH